MSETSSPNKSEALVTFEIELRPGANAEEIMALQSNLFEVRGGPGNLNSPISGLAA